MRELLVYTEFTKVKVSLVGRVFLSSVLLAFGMVLFLLTTTCWP